MNIDSFFDKHGLLLLSSDVVNIQGQEGYAQVTIQVITGTILITGATGYTIDGRACGTVTFTKGMAFTFGTGLSAVDDLTIDASSGSVLIVGVKVINPI
jgi:hypothetical protein